MIADAQKAKGDGVRFELGGGAIQGAEFVQGGGTEGLGILAAMVILLVSFGSLLAMGLPILSAIMGIGIALAILDVLTHVIEVPNFSPIVAAMIGIGVGIDYALFIVTRYRQSLHAGQDPEQATVTAITTAGKAVLFAGTTVIISVLGLLLMNLPFLQGMAPGLRRCRAGHHDRLGHPAAGHARLRRPHDRQVQAALHRSQRGPAPPGRVLVPLEPAGPEGPVAAFAAGALAVVLLAIPLFSMRLGFPGDDAQPESRTSRRSYDLLAEGFGRGFNAPLILAADTGKAGGSATATLQKLTETLRTDSGLAFVSPAQPNPSGDAAVITAIPATSAGDELDLDREMQELTAQAAKEG